MPRARRTRSLPVALSYRNRTVPLPAVALVPSAVRLQKVGSVKRICTPVMVPTVVPVADW